MKKYTKLAVIPMLSLAFSCVGQQNILFPQTSINNTSTDSANKSSGTVNNTAIQNNSSVPSSTTSSTIQTIAPTVYPSPSPFKPIPSGEITDLNIFNRTSNLKMANTNSDYRTSYYLYNSAINQQDIFDVKVTFKDGKTDNSNLIWKSSDETVATINNGVLTTLKAGYTSISVYSVTDKIRYAAFSVRVYDPLAYRSPDPCRPQDKIDTPAKFQAYIETSQIYSPTQPSGQTGSTSDTKERATFSGNIYDPNHNFVVGALITAKSIDPGVDWVGEAQVTKECGSYEFRNAPVGARIDITVTKDGWTTRDRSEVLKSNLNGDQNTNVFDFAGIYSIQDEPEITNLKVNGRDVLGAVSGDSFISNAPAIEKYTDISQITRSTYNPSLTGVSSDSLAVDMTFSEPVRHEDIEEYFRIKSQIFTTKNNKTFSIDQNLAGVTFTWSSDDKMVTFKTNKAVLANKDSDEARYAIEFLQPFRDKTDKPSKQKRYFRFSPSQINDFAIFSVKNDDQAPALLSILARDGGSSADTLELRYSEPMEVINESSVAAGLADPAFPSDTTRQLFAYSTQTTEAGKNPKGANNVTLLGYKNSAGNFIASYVVGRITSADITNQTPHLSSLNGNWDTTPVQYGGTDTFGYSLRSAKITGNTVLIELTPQAFNRDDRVIVSAGSNITATYSDRYNNVGSYDLAPDSLNLPSGSDFAQIIDPSGRLIDGGNSTTSANIDVNNRQRVSTVN